MIHELWIEGPDGQTFCLAGPLGNDARGQLTPRAVLVWTVEASSHFEAMTLYSEHMGWGQYTTDFPEIDKAPYSSRDRE